MGSKLKVAALLIVATMGLLHLGQLRSWAQDSEEDLFGFGADANGSEEDLFGDAAADAEPPADDSAVDAVDAGTGFLRREAERQARDAERHARGAEQKARESVSAFRTKVKARRDGGAETIVTFHSRHDLGHEIREAARALNEAEDNDAKAAAEEKLEDVLERYFNEDMNRREEELGRIEKQLAKLRELVDLRREKKEEIIKLQAKVALNEAAGLGFYGGEVPGGPLFVDKVWRGGSRMSNDVHYIPRMEPVPVPAVVPGPPGPPTGEGFGRGGFRAAPSRNDN